MKQLIKGLMVLLIVVSWQPAMATDHWASVEVTNVEVADGIYMLQGEGGNVGVSVGEDGTFIIDDQYAEMTAKLLTAIKSLSGEAPKFLINTHWHGDHAGGNENFGRKGAIIVAHENVRESLKVEKSIPAFNMHKPPSPKEALPVVTFRQQMSLHFNGDDVRLFHVANAHTDGDAVVYFERANVIHTGDTFFNGFYPFIDTASGGSLAGMIAASAAILEMANEQTRIIPGHGPLASRADLQTYHDMLVQAETAIGSLVKAGKSADEVVAAKPTAALDGVWGDGFLQPDMWVRIVYSGMKK
ncbi:MAG TPA: MBL fold metallo-hydrolase [Gammaproteobacteria bacterium]|nr:MBL fold metallo-hydrolase [Gammaproteobacteria bacterium]